MTVETPIQTTTTIPIQRKGRFVANLASNLTSFVVSIFIGIWFAPYVIRHLGIAGYGLIPLAMTLTGYLGLVTVTLNGAVGRFLIIAIERQDTGVANQVFNTALMGNVIIVIVLLIPAAVVASNASSFFNVPVGYEGPFGWLFFCAISSFFLTAISSTFSLATFCRNRFDLSSAIEILGNVTRVGLVVVLFRFCAPQLWQIGLGVLAAAMITTASSIIICKRLLPIVHIQPKSFSSDTLRELMSMGGWFFVGQLGTLLFLSIDIMVVNKMFGAEAGGRYGAIMQWSSLLRSLAGVIAGVFAPTIFMLYARKDILTLISYLQQTMKFLGLTLSLPIGIICGFSRPLLYVWLGPDFVSLAPLMSLMTIHLAINLGVLPLFNIRVVTNKVRVPAIVTCIAGVINLGLALLLSGPVGWGTYGVAGAGAIMLTTVNLIFGPLHAAHILGVPRGTFFRGTMPNICTTLLLTIVCWLVAHYFQIHSWLGLVIGGGAVAIGYGLYVFTMALKENEREMVVNMILPYLNRFRA